MRIDLEELGFDRGAHIIVQRELGGLPEGDALEVSGRDPHLVLHATTWCRGEGHGCEVIESTVGGAHAVRVRKGAASSQRERGAERSGPIDPGAAPGLLAHPPSTWGL